MPEPETIKYENITKINGSPITGWRVSVMRGGSRRLKYFPIKKYSDSWDKALIAALTYRDAAKRSLGIL